MLRCCCERFGDGLFDAVPTLWTLMSEALLAADDAPAAASPEAAVEATRLALSLLHELLPSLAPAAAAATLPLLEPLFETVLVPL